jgi:hypothetical protein
MDLSKTFAHEKWIQLTEWLKLPHKHETLCSNPSSRTEDLGERKKNGQQIERHEGKICKISLLA